MSLALLLIEIFLIEIMKYDGVFQQKSRLVTLCSKNIVDQEDSQSNMSYAVILLLKRVC